MEGDLVRISKIREFGFQDKPPIPRALVAIEKRLDDSGLASKIRPPNARKP